MITVYKFQKGGVKKGSVDDLGNSVKCWANCIRPNENELKRLSEKAKIPISELRSVMDPEERPKVADLKHYSLIIVRAPWTRSNVIKTTPIAIFVSKNKNNVITITLREISSVNNLKDTLKLNKIEVHERGLSYFTYRLLDEVLNRYFTILDDVEERIDKIEDKVIEQPNKMTVQEIFSMKNTLIFFHKALAANREVISSIEKEYVSHIDKKNVKRFSALYNEVTQLIDMVGTHREIMTGTLDLYISSLSNNLNQVMKTLTIIASFVLVPTLISGIYGMNFVFMPEINTLLGQQYGYYFALGLMALSVLGMFIYFKKKKWM